jgi:peptide chain release factor 1
LRAVPPAPPALTRPGIGFEVRGTLVEVIAGEGGDDAKLFAAELFRGYLALADRNGLTAEIEEAEAGKYSFIIPAATAYPLLSHETGNHCVQRIPANDRNGHRQTSYVSVIVTNLVTYGYTLKDADIEEDFQRGRGPGGQNQNKVSSAVRMRHRPTGISVFINGRSQLMNRQTARTCLGAKVKAHFAERAATARPGYAGAGRGTKIRTYNLLENRIVDHRTGAKCYRPELVLRQGRFELLS